MKDMQTLFSALIGGVFFALPLAACKAVILVGKSEDDLRSFDVM